MINKKSSEISFRVRLDLRDLCDILLKKSDGLVWEGDIQAEPFKGLFLSFRLVSSQLLGLDPKGADVLMNLEIKNKESAGWFKKNLNAQISIRCRLIFRTSKNILQSFAVQIQHIDFMEESLLQWGFVKISPNIADNLIEKIRIKIEQKINQRISTLDWKGLAQEQLSNHIPIRIWDTMGIAPNITAVHLTHIGLDQDLVVLDGALVLHPLIRSVQELNPPGDFSVVMNTIPPIEESALQLNFSVPYDFLQDLIHKKVSGRSLSSWDVRIDRIDMTSGGDHKLWLDWKGVFRSFRKARILIELDPDTTPVRISVLDIRDVHAAFLEKQFLRISESLVLAKANKEIETMIEKYTHRLLQKLQEGYSRRFGDLSLRASATDISIEHVMFKKDTIDIILMLKKSSIDILLSKSSQIKSVV